MQVEVASLDQGISGRDSAESVREEQKPQLDLTFQTSPVQSPE